MYAVCIYLCRCTGLYGMWNIYVFCLLIFYAPSTKYMAVADTGNKLTRHDMLACFTICWPILFHIYIICICLSVCPMISPSMGFKLACLVRQALCGQMSTYLADDVHLVSEGSRRSFGLPPITLCAVPRTCTHNSFGDRSFGTAGPRIWNSLPCSLRTLDISYKHFKTLLKTYMFG